MDEIRAEQIYNAPETIEVLYEGKPIWIEEINGSKAKIQIIGADKTINAPISELEDTGRFSSS